MDEAFTFLSLALVALWLLLALYARLQPSAHAVSRAVFWRGNAIIIIAITAWRVALFEFFWIPSSSMEPTLREWEVVAVNKRSYGLRMPFSGDRITEGRAPRRGEIAVFRYPRDAPDALWSTFYIKRIIALPGETVAISGDRISIDGQRLKLAGPAADSYGYGAPLLGGDPTKGAQLYWELLEGGWHQILLSDEDAYRQRYAGSGSCTLGTQYGFNQLECEVPEGHYFVMGDNRHHSNDSRVWGFVPHANLVGPAVRLLVSAADYRRSGDTLALAEQPQPVGTLEAPPEECWNALESLPQRAADETDAEHNSRMQAEFERLARTCPEQIAGTFRYLLFPPPP